MNLQDKIETETEYRVKGDLILTEDFKIDKNLVVEGNIRSAGGKWNIDAVDIDAVDIDARDIICEKRIKKTKDAKTICRIFIDNKSKLDRKERMKED